MIASIGLDELAKIAGIVLAFPVAIALVWGIARGSRHMALVHEAISGRPATEVSEKIPSMIERFQEVNVHLARQDVILGEVKAELTYNGGSTTKDQLRLVSHKVDDLKIGQAQAIGREDSIAGAAIRTAAALHDETVVTAAEVADTAMKVAEAVEKKRVAPVKKVARKRAPAKKVAPK